MEIFQNEKFGEVRTVLMDGEPWFGGKDVAVALGYKNPQEAIRTHVDEEDKGASEILTPVENRELWLLMSQDYIV